MSTTKETTQHALKQRQQAKEWAYTMVNSKIPSERHKASEGLYRQFYGSLKMYFMRRLGNFNGQNTYEDLTMKTLEKMFEKIEQFDPDMGEFSTWVFRIASNALVDEHRSFRGYDVMSTEAINHSRSESEDSTPFELPSQDENPEVLMEHFERQDAILSAIQSLSDPKDAMILLLRFYNSCSYKEIQDHMGWPLGTVQARLNRAKQKLAGVLDPQWALA